MQLTGLWDGYLRLSIIPMAQKTCSFYLQPVRSRTSNIINLWKPHQQRLETRSTTENLRMSNYMTPPWWSWCDISRTISNFFPMKRHWKRTESNEYSKFRAANVHHHLATAAESHWGCPVVSAESTVQKRRKSRPTTWATEAWAKIKGVGRIWVCILRSELFILDMPLTKQSSKLSNRTAMGYYNWKPSKLELYWVVSHCPQRVHCTKHGGTYFQKNSPPTPTAKDLR